MKFKAWLDIAPEKKKMAPHLGFYTALISLYFQADTEEQFVPL